jgi:23S rRNA pseudouridine1911/1915/1917 synthase
MVEEEEQITDQEDFYEHFRLVVDKGQQSTRIDKFLSTKLSGISRNRLQNAAEAGCIRVNDKAVKSNYRVKSEDIITILLPQPPRDNEIIAENIPLNIVYEDEWLLVVNKPAGMVVHPAYANYTGTLVNALVYHFENLPTAGGERRPGLVHRIDKDTSGLLVIAKDEITMTNLARQFFDHSIDRAYVALTWGIFTEKNGTVSTQLGRSLKDRRITQVYKDSEIGKLAITHYNVIEEFHYTSLIECRLETGRTHQIRVHMQYLGHPIFNDSTYGGNKILSGPTFTKYKQFIDNCFAICPRQALHAKLLAFTHPKTGERMHFEAALPEDMQRLVDKWRNYTSNVGKTE